MFEMQPNFVDHILMFLLGVVLPVFAVFRSQPELKKMQFDSETKIAMYLGNSLFLWLMALVVMAVWWFSDRSLTSLGFGLPDLGGNLWIWITAVFCLAYAFDVWFQISSTQRKEKMIDRWQQNTPFLPQTKKELYYFFIVSLSAGFCEEVIFRGYFIQYIWHFTGDSLTGQMLAIFIPGAVFAFSHFYQGWQAVLKIVVMAFLFGALFCVTRSLWVVIILHILVDVIGGYLSYWLMPVPAIAIEKIDTKDEEEE